MPRRLRGLPTRRTSAIATSAAQPIDPGNRAFAALANVDFRIYLVCSTAVMMADNIEHVISYWVIFQKFHSPALGGFAVVSHWVPYLLFAAYTGAMADRFDIRRLIQVGMLLFMGVSLCWGLMFFTQTLALWKAAALLVVHGLAGVLWVPASQVLIHRMVRAEQLPSAVRMNATGRYLGFLVGPAVGAGLLLAFGPAYGIVINALIYAPLFLWLIKAPYGPGSAGLAAHPTAPMHAAEPATAAARVPDSLSAPARNINGFADIWATMKVVANSPVLLSMTFLIGAAAFFVGNAYQAQMPGFALDLGHGRADFSYSMLLAADAAGGLAAGLILESRGLLPPNARTAFTLAMIWCATLAGFALSHNYVLAIGLLLVAGFVELAFNAMAQSLVQIHAPAAIRGRVIGVFSMSSMGLRAFSGVFVGLLGAKIGIHHSLALSAGCLFLIYAVVIVVRRSPRRGQRP
jgi:MFS family permease